MCVHKMVSIIPPLCDNSLQVEVGVVILEDGVKERGQFSMVIC
jgi:hypothetical protein